MGQIGRTALKTYFETGDKPTEAEFIDLIDSFFNFTDDAATQLITKVNKATSKTSDFQLALAANTRLLSIDFKVNSGTPLVTVGTTNGATDVIWSQNISVNTPFNVPFDFEAAQTLWFGISSGDVDINTTYYEDYF